MKILLQNGFALLCGLFLGGIVNMALVTAGPHVFPAPAGVDMSDAKSLNESVHLLQPQHFVFPFLAHALGTLAGAMVAGFIGTTRSPLLSYIVGVFFLAGGITAAFMIAAPVWFIALDLVVAYLPMAWLAGILVQRVRSRPRAIAPGA